MNRFIFKLKDILQLIFYLFLSIVNSSERKKLISNIDQNAKNYLSKKRGIPSILFCFLPKSASGHISYVISKGLGLPNIQIASPGPLNEGLLDDSAVSKFAQSGYFSCMPLPGTERNLQALRGLI